MGDSSSIGCMPWIVGVGLLAGSATYINWPPAEGDNIYITCPKDAPTGLVATRKEEDHYTHLPKDITYFKDWCDVKSIIMRCDPALQAPSATIAKTEAGYTFTRPSKYCKVEFYYYTHRHNLDW